MNAIIKERETKQGNYIQYGVGRDMDEVEGCAWHLMEGVRHALETTLKHKGKVPEDCGFAFAIEPEKGHLVYLAGIVYRAGWGDIPTFRERLKESGYRNVFILDDETLLSIARERCR